MNKKLAKEVNEFKIAGMPRPASDAIPCPSIVTPTATDGGEGEKNKQPMVGEPVSRIRKPMQVFFKKKGETGQTQGSNQSRGRIQKH